MSLMGAAAFGHSSSMPTASSGLAAPPRGHSSSPIAILKHWSSRSIDRSCRSISNKRILQHLTSRSWTRCCAHATPRRNGRAPGAMGQRRAKQLAAGRTPSSDPSRTPTCRAPNRARLSPLSAPLLLSRPPAGVIATLPARPSLSSSSPRPTLQPSETSEPCPPPLARLAPRTVEPRLLLPVRGLIKHQRRDRGPAEGSNGPTSTAPRAQGTCLTPFDFPIIGAHELLPCEEA